MLHFHHDDVIWTFVEEKIRQNPQQLNPSTSKSWLTNRWETAVCMLGKWLVSIGRRLECYQFRPTVRST